MIKIFALVIKKKMNSIKFFVDKIGSPIKKMITKDMSEINFSDITEYSDVNKYVLDNKLESILNDKDSKYSRNYFFLDISCMSFSDDPVNIMEVNKKYHKIEKIISYFRSSKSSLIIISNERLTRISRQCDN